MKARNMLRQQGLTLIELIGALAIGSVMLIGLVTMIDNSLEDMKGQQAAMYQAQLTSAVGKYITANYQTLTSTLPIGGAAKAYNVATLSAANVLPSGFSDKNAYLQQGCALIRQSAAGQLDAFVVTTGGMPIADKNIPAVAANAGSGSGYIATTDTGTVKGASWTLATTAFRNVICAGGTALTGGAADGGHLVSRVFQNGGPMADFLYRDDIGVPALNTMNTPIRMANNAVVVEGAACSGAAIAVDANNNIMRCSSAGTWTSISTWKEPVATYGALPSTDQDGDVRMALDIGKAFMRKGGTWIALAEDQNGDLIVTRNVTIGTGTPGGSLGDKLTVYGHTEIKDSLHTTDHINTDADINAKGNAYIGGDMTVGNVASQRGDVIIGRSVKVGDVSGVLTRNGVTGTRPGDIWAGGDVQSLAEMRTAWFISDSSVTGESLFINYNNSGHFAGGACNLTLTDRNGNPYKAWPVGTITAEGGNGWQRDGAGNPSIGYPVTGSANTGKALYCGADQVWHYINE